MIPDPEKTAAKVEDPPPILGSWRNFYALVLGMLVLDIVMLYLFTRIFS
jgi:hypothetical protein